MNAQLERTERLFGAEAMERLRRSRVLVFGAGGVGGFVIEALTRSGVGTLGICDSDDIALSNLNRQIIATHRTVGMQKADAYEARIREIDPDIIVKKYPVFYLPDSETAELFDFSEYDYIVDAIDTVAAKIDIILRAIEAGTPVISSMGCGNRVDPGKLAITDIYKTNMDPLAKVMRRELKKRGVKKLKVLCSSESPVVPLDLGTGQAEDFGQDGAEMPQAQRTPAASGKKVPPGSTAFVPSAGGLMIAAEVVRDLTGFDPAGRTKGGKQTAK